MGHRCLRLKPFFIAFNILEVWLIPLDEALVHQKEPPALFQVAALSVRRTHFYSKEQCKEAL